MADSTTKPVWSEEFFQAKDGLKLFQASLVPAEPKAVVAIVHGYGDHALRYRPLMEELARAGLAAYAVDYRGHGQAGGRRGFVAHFNDFVDDVGAFFARVRAKNKDLPLLVFAHSHGALVTCTLLANGEKPEGLKALVLSAPYFRLKIVPSQIQLFLAKFVGKVIPWLPMKNPLTVDQLSRDEAFQKATSLDPLRHTLVTPKWFTESTEAQRVLATKWETIDLPLLVIQGSADTVADPAAAKEFYEASRSKDKTLRIFEGGRHETFYDLEKETFFKEVVAWCEAHVSAKAAA